jgi:hypothetical protein
MRSHEFSRAAAEAIRGRLRFYADERRSEGNLDVFCCAPVSSHALNADARRDRIDYPRRDRIDYLRRHLSLSEMAAEVLDTATGIEVRYSDSREEFRQTVASLRHCSSVPHPDSCEPEWPSGDEPGFPHPSSRFRFATFWTRDSTVVRTYPRLFRSALAESRVSH